MVRLTDRPDMTLDVYRGRKTTMQQQQQMTLEAVQKLFLYIFIGQLNMVDLLSIPVQREVTDKARWPDQMSLFIFNIEKYIYM